MKLKYCTFLMLFIFLVPIYGYADNHVITINIVEDGDSITISPQLDFSTSAQIKEAIDSGIRIQIIAKAQIIAKKTWWFDQTIKNNKMILEVSYFTLGKLYIVKNKETGKQLGFNSYEQLWKGFEKLISYRYKKAICKNRSFKMRIVLDKGALPTAMQLPVLFNSNWDINTPWYQQDLEIR
jgi:hypothetical protein